MKNHNESLFNTSMLKGLFVCSLIAVCSSCASTLKTIKPPTTVLTNKIFLVADVSPDSRTIVFALAKWGKESQLFKVNADGTNLTPLTSGETYDCEPAFSPDGSKVVYYQGSEGNGDLCVINLDGSGKQRITSGPENDFEPVWSADGDRIFFLRASTFTNYSPIARPGWHKVDIYWVKPDGSDLTRITHEASFRMADLSLDAQSNSLMVLNWSQGQKIQIMSVDKPTDKKVVRPSFKLDRAKTFPPLIRDADYESIQDAQLGPDGKNILFTYSGDLYVMDLETSAINRIWKWESKDERTPSNMYPRFSFDGQRILFVTVRGGKSHGIWGNTPWPVAKNEPELWVINKDGTPIQGKTPGPIFNSEILMGKN